MGIGYRADTYIGWVIGTEYQLGSGTLQAEDTEQVETARFPTP